ncbi:WhiB family transcriptional regulator [Streptomyces sp. NPDC048479]|uniref:WhiB family transcriptional regulator n=1 Tax=Streptomyces sp. NPDC048479 TaxID=3154725 RepID=UPI003425F396
MLTPRDALRALTDHPRYHYRGCGPDAEDPARAAGDPDLSVDAWGPYTGDGAEPQAGRHARERAAKQVCSYCPVKDACRAYANTETADGHLAEPEGIWGGQLALERHRALIARRTHDSATGIPERDLAACRTPQKRAVLRALARETDDELVAYRAGMDLRTANWNRSALCGLLGLDRETATRQQLLDTAREHGLIPPSLTIRPDGRWPYAAAPTTDGIRQRRIAPGRPIQLLIPGLPHYPRGRHTPPAPQTAAAVPAARGPRRLRLVPPLAQHPTLLPVPTARLEAAS